MSGVIRDLSADERVAAWVLQQFRNERYKEHLTDCPDARAEVGEGSDGYYGCDTGCEYASMVAVISCPHGGRRDYDYGEFGELADILAEIEMWATP